MGGGAPIVSQTWGATQVPDVTLQAVAVVTGSALININQRVPCQSSEVSDPHSHFKATKVPPHPSLQLIISFPIKSQSYTRVIQRTRSAFFATWPGWDPHVRGNCRTLAPKMPPAQEPYLGGGHMQSQEDYRFPTKPFDPKAVTRASWEPERKKPPKKDGPLLSFNRHPEYAVALVNRRGQLTQWSR